MNSTPFPFRPQPISSAAPRRPGVIAAVVLSALTLAPAAVARAQVGSTSSRRPDPRIRPGEAAAPTPPTATAAPTTSAPAAPTTSAPAAAPTTRVTVPVSSVPTAGLTDLFVSPTGNDAGSGATRSTALRTVAEAWRRIPQGRALTTGYRIAVTAGTYTPRESLPNYWEARYGTATAPIVLTAVDGPGTVTLRGDLNVFNVRYLTVDGVRISGGGDAFHCEQCRNVTIRRSELDGGRRAAHETLKVNQSSDIVIEDNDIHGADDNAIDFVAVDGGRITGNRIHDANDWCAYVKGGSADITVADNEIYDCGTGGFTAGQGTGLEFMVAPHLTYEAERITVRDNEIHDTEGAGLGVNGGSAIVMTGNHLQRVGRRSHLVEFGFGSRSCDGDVRTCRALLAQGAWGNAQVGDGSNYVRIPNRDIRFEGNTIENPSGAPSQWQHFAVPGPVSGAVQAGSAANPNPARADDLLVIRGNTIRNGGPDMPLGIGDSEGCAPANPTCNEAQLRRDNRINA